MNTELSIIFKISQVFNLYMTGLLRYDRNDIEICNSVN